MRRYYDIVVVYERMDDLQVAKLSQIVRTVKYDPGKQIQCDTLILNRLTDQIKPNIIYQQSIQVCHACQQANYRIPTDRDILVNVSEAAKESWGDESKHGLVIHNMPYAQEEPCLMLVSATRVNAKDKGQNDIRMRKLAEMLDEAAIKFIWLNFADAKLTGMPKSFINMPAMANIQPYITKADYLVQLSDTEAYSMSILEALTLNTAVIATPFPSLFEEGFEDGKTGYVVPFNMKFDVKKLLDVPKFEYKHDNIEIINQWRRILGNKKPKRDYIPQTSVSVTCTNQYYDNELRRTVRKGETIQTSERRAQLICGAGYGRRG